WLALRTVTNTSWGPFAACHAASASALNLPVMGSVRCVQSADTSEAPRFCEDAVGAADGRAAGVVSLHWAPHPRLARPSTPARSATVWFTGSWQSRCSRPPDWGAAC